MNRIAHGSRSFALMTGLVMFAGVAVAPAMAATIIYNFSGEVDRIGNLLSPPPLPFNTSSDIEGSMTVKMSDKTPGNATRGTYEIESFSVTIGGSSGYTYSFGPSTNNNVVIRNLSGEDRFVTNVNDLSGPSVGSGLAPDFFGINLRGPNTLFGNDALPGAADLPASINSFDQQHTWRLVFGLGGNRRTVSGDLTSLTAVPLPAAVVLFGVGLVALIGLGAGGLRNLRLPQA